MPSTKNQQQVSLIQEKLAKAKSVAVVEYSGTTVNDQVTLRRQLKASGGELLVTKNTLINVAAGEGKLSDSLSGMNALVISYDDEVGALKSLFAFHKDTEKLIIKQGLLGEAVLSPQQVEDLSKLPGKTELIATLLSRLQGPSYGMVNVLQAGSRNLVNVLHAIAQKAPTQPSEAEVATAEVAETSGDETAAKTESATEAAPEVSKS